MLPFSCDTLVALGNATQNGQTIFAKNSDLPATECQPLVFQERQQHQLSDVVHCQFVSLPQAPITYRHIGSRPYWCWGYEHGFNEHQVVIGNEALFSKLPEGTKPRLVGMEILRLGLERSRTAMENVFVKQKTRQMIIKKCVSLMIDKRRRSRKTASNDHKDSKSPHGYYNRQTQAVAHGRSAARAPTIHRWFGLGGLHGVHRQLDKL